MAVWGVSSATPAGAQQIREAGLQGVVTSSDPAVAVFGPYGALRALGRTRVSGFIGGGVSDQEFAWRAEALAHFLLSPDRRSGWGVYAASGLAAVGGSDTHGYLVLTLGAESSPGRPSGWVAEAGIGGGIRVALGYRWRWFPAVWPQ